MGYCRTVLIIQLGLPWLQNARRDARCSACSDLKLTAALLASCKVRSPESGEAAQVCC